MIQTFESVDALRKLVDYIWIADFDFLAAESREDIIMPQGHINIIFNYGSAYKRIGAKQETIIPNAAVIGQIKTAKYVQYGSCLHQVGISLTPLGFITLFDVPSIQLTERIVNAVEVDSGLSDMYRAIINYNDVELKISAIHHALLHKLSQRKADTVRMEEMLNYVEREYKNLSIATMAEFFSVSVSTLERVFKRKVGLPPKTYGDIIKFRKLTEDKENRSVMQQHYYDQSHLIKTSKRFAGKTIKELERPTNEITLSYLWNDQ